MKLLMITGLGSASDLASGKKGAFYSTLQEFSQYWDRIDVVCPRVKDVPAEQVLFGNVHVHVSTRPLFLHPLYFVKKCLQLHKQFNFDLMTVQEFPPFYNGIGAWLVSTIARLPYILEIMHVPGYPRAGNFKERIYRWLAEAFLEFDSDSARAVRVINEAEMPEFLIRAGVPAKKLIYIPANYIDLDIFKPLPEEAKKYDLIFIGRLEINKGVDIFLETVKKLGCSALIVGSGSLKNEIKSKVEKWELKIDMHGWAKDSAEIAKLLNQSKLLVMPSYNEGGPRVVLEAMACGLPVLASRVGIVSDVVTDGQTGYIVDWNAGDISAKARLILNDNKFSGAACLEMASRFEKKAAIKNYADKLKQLI